MQTHAAAYLCVRLCWPHCTGVSCAGFPCHRPVPVRAGSWQQGQDAAVGFVLVTRQLPMAKSAATRGRALRPRPSHPPAGCTDTVQQSLQSCCKVAAAVSKENAEEPALENFRCENS